MRMKRGISIRISIFMNKVWFKVEDYDSISR